jgi:RNA polymerase sigma-70 factor (ECF subfamily)
VRELERWLAEGYERAYRTACLVLRNPADAEEAVQEAFLRAWRFRNAVRDEERGQAWLYRVLVNTCCSKLRSEAARRSRAAGPEALDGVPDRGASPEAAAGHAETAAALARAVAALPDHLRIPLVLRYYSGLSEQEVADAIRRRPGTVKSRLHEARRRLGADPALSALALAEEETR